MWTHKGQSSSGPELVFDDWRVVCGARVVSTCAYLAVAACRGAWVSGSSRGCPGSPGPSCPWDSAGPGSAAHHHQGACCTAGRAAAGASWGLRGFVRWEEKNSNECNTGVNVLNRKVFTVTGLNTDHGSLMR